MIRHTRPRNQWLIAFGLTAGLIAVGFLEIITVPTVTFGGVALLLVLAGQSLLATPIALAISALAAAVATADSIFGGTDPFTSGAQLVAIAALTLVTQSAFAAQRRAEALMTSQRDELERRAGELQKMNASLQRFTADASHEFRLSLAIMRSTVDGALVPDLSAPADSGRALAALDREIDRLSATTDALLLLARADAGLLSVGFEEVDLPDLLEEVAARWETAIERDGLQLFKEWPLDGTIKCHPLLVIRVLDNLLDNALRHSPRSGTVGLTAALGEGGWSLSVTDDGEGIPSAERVRVFERFARLSEARTRSTSGAGLGLALCEAIVALHGGTIRVADRSPTGTAVIVTLPLEPGPPQLTARDRRPVAMS